MLDTEYNEAEVKELFMADGIRGAVAILRDLGLDDATILEKIIKQYNLTPDQAKIYI